MRFWPWKRKPADEIRVRLVDRPHTALRADEFRADKELVHLAATVLANPNVQLMIQVLKNEHPALEVLPFGTNPNDRLLAQGRGEGFTMALATFEALGTKATLPERLVSTFGAVDTANAETG